MSDASSALASRTAAWFAECYRQQPGAVWHAPGRVNLIGEHTDYNDGFALPFALGRGVCAAAARRPDGVLELRSRQATAEPVTLELAHLAPGCVTGWAAYPAGVAWALLQAGHRVGGASVAIDANLEPGAGLSSSAALTCSAALALADVHGLAVPRAELAALSRTAENDFAGAPTGIMDHTVSLFGQAGHALLLDCRAGPPAPVPLGLAAAGLAVPVIDTGVRHALADGRYAQRRRDCEAAASALGVPALRDVAGQAADALADPVLRRRARHVVTENARVLAAARLLRAREPEACGELLSASHASLRDDFEVSWPEADEAVSAACEAGALGARMTGGGFGGSVIALVPRQQLAAVRRAIAAAYARRGWPPPGCSAARPSAGARRAAGRLAAPHLPQPLTSRDADT